MAKRKVEILVLSDIHLGTYGCHAEELTQYLKRIKPEKVILNGDIIDIWQFSKNYFPKSHLEVIKLILKFLGKGIPVYYITGNHDEFFRKFTDFNLGDFRLIDKLSMDIDGKKTWFFHGDVFDITMKNSKWLAKLGAIGYDTLILINRGVNYVLDKMGKEKYSLSQKVKNGVKSAIKFIDDFEATACDIAIENGFQTVVCGHIHQPIMRQYKNDDGTVMYLNSGDWIENLTSLEYNEGKWSLYQYKEKDYFKEEDDDEDDDAEETTKLNSEEEKFLDAFVKGLKIPHDKA
jgi:UDP-2,3-diacylglucosamine pyrophosphatase LpxH